MREYGIATACQWISNSPKVAATHYDISIDIDVDYRRAAGLEDDSKTQQKAQKTVTERPCRRATSDTRGPEKPLKNNASDNFRPSGTKRAKGVSWAIQDSNL